MQFIIQEIGGKLANINQKILEIIVVMMMTVSTPYFAIKYRTPNVMVFGYFGIEPTFDGECR